MIYALPPADPSAEQLEVLCSSLSSFVAANDNPASSPHLNSTTPDRMDGLVQLLTRPEINRSSDACILVLKASRADPRLPLLCEGLGVRCLDMTQPTQPRAALPMQALKILARRQDNRQRCGGHTFQTLMPFCSTKQPPVIASEAANAALNLAYEAQNVVHLVRCKGEAALLQLLAGGHDEVLVNVAGAVQTLCYQVGWGCSLEAAAAALAELREQKGGHPLLTSVRCLRGAPQRPSIAICRLSPGWKLLWMAAILARPPVRDLCPTCCVGMGMHAEGGPGGGQARRRGGGAHQAAEESPARC